MASTVSGLLRELKRRLRLEDRFLKEVSGVIHIGANVGQERKHYARYNLPVVWVEPIPWIFDILVSNLAEFPSQTAYRRLIAEADGTKYTFHISNNEGLSSSILEFAEHRDVWPDIDFLDSIELEAISLPSFVREQNIDLKSFNALVLDTQGSELLILRGGSSILRNFLYVKSEVPDFESYVNCCTLNDLTDFMKSYGFICAEVNKLEKSPKGGRYYDVIYKRI